MKVDFVLISLVDKVLHLYPAIVVQVALVSNKYFNGAGRTDTFYTFVPVRNTLECCGKVNRVNDDYCVGAMQEVLGHLLLSSFASCVPDVKLDFLGLTVLTATWHVYNLVLVLDSYCWFLLAESVCHELMDDGGLADVRIANQNDFSFRNVV